MTMQQQYYYATGRRKSAVAQVRLYMESGPIVVNGKPIEEAFPWDNWQREIMEPFRITHYPAGSSAWWRRLAAAA